MILYIFIDQYIVCHGRLNNTGVIETPMTNDVLVDENVKNHLLTRIPLKRVAQASEVASLVYFLATDESSYITGTYIPIDGGYLSS